MSDKSRRKLLKSIAAGSGAIVAGKSLPESWSRPVVDSVMLPAHAVTSAYSYSTRQTVGSVAPESNYLLAGFISNANAGVVMGEDFVDYCVDIFGQAWRAAIRTTTNGCLVGVWWAEGTVGGGHQIMTQNLCADFKHPNITFNVKANDASTAIVEILEGGEPNPLTSIPIGNCPFGDPMAEQCCEIAGTYCGNVIGTVGGYIHLRVNPDGMISIDLGDSETADPDVNPYCGGSFDDVRSSGGQFDVAGRVNCGETSISGTITRVSDSAVFTYIATMAHCE